VPVCFAFFAGFLHELRGEKLLTAKDAKHSQVRKEGIAAETEKLIQVSGKPASPFAAMLS
jgi:hypothetical protein